MLPQELYTAKTALISHYLCNTTVFIISPIEEHQRLFIGTEKRIKKRDWNTKMCNVKYEHSFFTAEYLQD